MGELPGPGKAKASGKKTLRDALIETRDTLEQFENLVMMGARPVTIKTLMSLDYSDKEIRNQVRQVSDRLGVQRVHQKGKVVAPNSPDFLKKLIDRYHATVLIGIAKRLDLMQTVVDETYVGALVDIYQTYVSTFRTNVDDARLSFELAIVILAGWQAGDVGTAPCGNCGSHFVVRAHDLGSKADCPVCKMHCHPKLDLQELCSSGEESLPNHVFGIPYSARFGS